MITSHEESPPLDPRWGESTPTHDPRVLAHFEPRHSDILITTAPKSGTTWMQQILHQLRSGGDTHFRSINDVVPWLEKPNARQTWQQRLQQFAELPDPRIFKTHCTAEQTPGIDRVNIILSSRDPRDCCVSMYHHILNMTEATRAQTGIPCPQSFDQHVEQWLSGGAWYRNIKSWWPYHDHPNVLWLRYQDMKHDLAACMNQIIDFLKWQITTEQKARALEQSSFEWMKQHDEKFSRQDSTDKPLFKPGQFIRKGEVGSHQKMMTTEQEERILNQAHQWLDKDCLHFLEL